MSGFAVTGDLTAQPPGIRGEHVTHKFKSIICDCITWTHEKD